MRSLIPIVAVIALLACASRADASDVAPLRLSPVSTTPANAKLSARDAGSRFGEAAGAALVCYGLKIMPDQVTQLRARYSGGDLSEFDEAAARVLEAWRATLKCEGANGSSECRVTQQWSCRQALQDIGPAGSAVRGLIEPKN